MLKNITDARPIVFSVLILVFFLLWGKLTSLCLGINISFFTPTIIYLWNNGEYLHTLITLLILTLPISAYYLWHKDGYLKLASLYVLYIFMLIILSSIVAILIYNLLENVSITPLPWVAYYLIIATPKYSKSYDIFLFCYIFSLFVGLSIPVINGYIRRYKMKKQLGEAHFSNFNEVKKGGLLNDKGIVLGKIRNKILRFSGYESVLVVAPTGSGKSSASAIPTLLEWNGSVVVNDIKGELYRNTAKFREEKLKNKVIQFSPIGQECNGLRYNPFFYVNKNEARRHNDLTIIANAFINETNGDSFWYESARELLITFALYLLETTNEASFGEIEELSKTRNLSAYLLTEIADNEDVFSRALINGINSFCEMDERTQKNVLKNLQVHLSPFINPALKYSTSKNDFDLRDLRKELTSVYINIPPAYISQMSSLLTVFWAQVTQFLTENEPDNNDEPYAVLGVLDEFGVLGKIKQLVESVAFLRQYKFSFIFYVQYLSQIYAKYGRYDAEAFLSAKAKVIFTLSSASDAKYFSDQMGVKTVHVKSKSTSVNGTSNSEHPQTRPLMQTNELMTLKKNQSIILIEGKSPIKAKKVYWFKERKYLNILAEINNNYKR